MEMATSKASRGITRTDKLRRKNRRRKDDILECPDIENISFDIDNRESSVISPYDSDFVDSSEPSESSSWLIIPSEANDLNECKSFHSQTTDFNCLDLSHGDDLCANRSATSNTAIEKATTNHEEIYQDSTRETRGLPQPTEMHKDIPNCPKIEEMDHIQPLSMTWRAQKNENLSKLADTAIAMLAETLSALFGFVCYALRFPRLSSAFLLFGGVYVFASYLELSVAATIQFVFSFLWPTFHVSLRFIEQLFKNIGSRIAAYDDVGQAMYCDIAQTLCTQFGVCDNVCSFTNLAMERFR